MSKYQVFFKVLIFFGLIGMCNACSNDSSIAKEEKEFNCSFEFLEKSTINSKRQSGNTARIDATINGNLNKFASLNGKLSISDTFFVKRIDVSEYEMKDYTTEFMQKHNAIINVLCAIEKQLEVGKISDSLRLEIQLNLIEKYNQYFNLTISEFNSSSHNEEKEIKNIQVKDRKIEVNYLASLYIDKGVFIVSDTKLNGDLLHRSGNSTSTNIRFKTKHKNITLEFIKKNGETCTYNYQLSSKKNANVFTILPC